EAPVDYSYLDLKTNSELRTLADGGNFNSAEAAEATTRLQARERDGYYAAQQNFANLANFIREWSGSDYANYASTDLASLIQNRKSSYTSNVWIVQSTAAYRAPTYSADWLDFTNTSGVWKSTGTINGDNNLTWVELSVNYQNSNISVYVPGTVVSYS